jgi:hypothetical protein
MRMASASEVAIGFSLRHVLARLEAPYGNFSMAGMRRRNHDRVDLASAEQVV